MDINMKNIKNILEEKCSATERILPLYEAPVKGLQFFILETIFNEEKIMPWFYCNYIQLEWLEDWCINFSMLQDYYVGYTFIDKQIFIREILNSIDFIELILNCINMGWYMHLSLDEYYIPHKSAHKEYHYIHDNMICGYDLKDEKFFIYGYSKHKKLEVTKVSFQDLKKSYQSLEKKSYGNFENSIQYYNLIFMIKKNLSINYEMDIEFLKSSIVEYLNGVPYVEKFRMYKNLSDKKTYGINILKKMIKLFKEGDKSILTDYRPIITICEHNLIMSMRVNYLMEKCYIKYDKDFYEEFCKVTDKAVTVKNLQLYYSIGKSKEEILKKIIVILGDVYTSQIELFNKLLNQL